MKKLLSVKNATIISILMLGIFLTTVFEATFEHFFHDYFPENGDGYFLVVSQRPQTGTFSNAEKYEKDIDCPFNLFLSFLEQTFFEIAFTELEVIDFTDNIHICQIHTRFFYPGYFRKSRGPPAAGQTGIWC